jgi:hypothetical protein
MNEYSDGQKKVLLNDEAGHPTFNPSDQRPITKKTLQGPLTGLAEKVRKGLTSAALEYASRPPGIDVSRSVDGSGLRGRWKMLEVFRSIAVRFDFEILMEGEAVGALPQSPN